MSGHSKWAKIKRQKGVTDAKRGALFTKLGRNITMAAMEAGGDPTMNFSLRLAIDKAKQANMPQDNIERAVKKGTGELQSDTIQRTTYEALLPSGVGVLIDCATDNTNRSVSEIRNLIESAGAKFAAIGSVSWQFSEQGEIEVGAAKLHKSEKYGHPDYYSSVAIDELEMFIMDIDGVLDYSVFDPISDPDFEPDENRPADRKYLTITCDRTNLKNISDQLHKGGWQVLDSTIVKRPQSTVDINSQAEEKLQNLVDQMEERDDVDNVWTNAA